MRERKGLDRKHLPASTYELWLTRQRARGHRTTHRIPPKDAYEDWVAGRVRSKEVARRPMNAKTRRA